MTASLPDQILDVGHDLDAFLYLIEKHKGLSGYERLTAESRDAGQDFGCIRNILEDRPGLLLMKEVNYDNGLVMAPPKTLDDKRLADLSCAINQQSTFSPIGVELLKTMLYLAF